ncbi:hypothetical protein [Nocardia altamirensis]|uniref:hypothetical protein n=1 Tax=Nocardia altamirensis TaxID=472158 RepID=UPI0008406994|nr:hypothetical protein [Nocardia altamirensis]
MTYDDYRARIIAAQEQWNRERQNIYDFTRRIDETFDGEFEPPKIPGPDNYDSMSLAQMVDAVNSMRPSAAHEASQAWLNISMNLTGATEAFNREFARTISGAWTGKSGAAATKAVNDYSEKSKALASATGLVSFKLSELHTGLNQTQALMPQATQRPDLMGKTLPQNGAMKAGDYSEEEATQEARRILRTVYGQVANQTDQGVPVLPAAPSIVEDSPKPNSAPSQENSPGTTNSPGAQENSTTGEPGSTEQESKAPDQQANDPTQPAGTDPSAPGSPATTTAGTESGTPSNVPTTTSPNTTNTGSPSTGNPNLTTATPTPSRPLSTSPGTPGRPNIPGTPGTSGTPGTPSPGRSIPGSPQPVAAPAAAVARTDGTTGRPGAGGTGIAPGMAGKGKDDEQEKSGTKDYLITQANGNEVTGLDSLPKAVPPVLGSD